ncbi:MAG: hypothetical protein K2N85_12175, partial [Lachnospiraceae bacterium]|nr:hypothetical protein [Lachnospiraceae bacterium]
MSKIWTEQIKKRFRNAGILAVALCVVIGIAVMKQDREEQGGEELSALAADVEPEGQEAADADTDKQCGGYCYEILSDGTVEIAAYQGSETTLFIPAYMEDKPVRVIGE